jgi:hypothetical protein
MEVKFKKNRKQIYTGSIHKSHKFTEIHIAQFITKLSNPSQSHQIHHKFIIKSIHTTSWTSHHAYGSRVAIAWLAGVATAISQSELISM